MNQRISLTDQVHTFIRKQLAIGDIAIDATMGNGYDTVFLAKLVGLQGVVFGFDIQQQAVELTRLRLQTENILDNTTLFNTSHSNINAIPTQYHGKVKAIMFNLGYLPGSDKTVITQSKSTLIALNKSIKILVSKGIITVTAYPGHKGGEQETEHIEQWCKQLNPKDYMTHQINSSEKVTAPKAFIILKN